jgi:hypothetical protein
MKSVDCGLQAFMAYPMKQPDPMRRIAAPMIGGIVSSTVLTLVVIPVIYALVKSRRISRRLGSIKARA